MAANGKYDNSTYMWLLTQAEVTWASVTCLEHTAAPVWAMCLNFHYAESWLGGLVRRREVWGSSARFNPTAVWHGDRAEVGLPRPGEGGATTPANTDATGSDLTLLASTPIVCNDLKTWTN